MGERLVWQKILNTIRRTMYEAIYSVGIVVGGRCTLYSVQR
jgi:uncharacterized protein YhaN